MGPAHVGVDLVPLARARALVEPQSAPVLRKMLTDAEYEQCTATGRPDCEGVAGRLAAKEAVFKALRTSGHTLRWHEIEILTDAGGRPRVRLHGRTARHADAQGVAHIDVSITHDDPCAIAVALCAGATGTAPGTPALSAVSLP
ncbi:holo-ACP synthase [Streptomyces sp. NPDC001941]|uniref:holo-ACP synthase n=1 Tax=Streptomyces sp. NPDC001941 TaxID=3154659 RepID=UPI003324DD8A